MRVRLLLSCMSLMSFLGPTWADSYTINMFLTTGQQDTNSPFTVTVAAASNGAVLYQSNSFTSGSTTTAVSSPQVTITVVDSSSNKVQIVGLEGGTSKTQILNIALGSGTAQTSSAAFNTQGKVFQSNGQSWGGNGQCKIELYLSGGTSPVNTWLSNATTGAFSLSYTPSQWPTNETVTLKFYDPSGSNTQTITNLLGPGAATMYLNVVVP